MTNKSSDNLAASYYASGLAVSHFVYAARNIGLDMEAELERSGLLRARDYEPLSRIPGEQYEQLVMTLFLASGDPLFGFHTGQQLLIGQYGVASHLLLSSATLKDALQWLEPYQLLVGNMGKLAVQHDDHGGAELSFWMAHESRVLRHQVVDNVFTMIVQAARISTSKMDLAPGRISFEYPAPDPVQRREMETFFKCPLVFDANANVIELPASLLKVTVCPYGQEMAASLEAEVARQLRVLQEQDSLLGQIKHQLRVAMQNSFPRRQQVADNLGMSVRTLDRRMAEEGISWQQLLDVTRANLAREFLTNTDMTMVQISERLGFSDVRSFQRRFRHWTGMAPSAFRQENV